MSVRSKASGKHLPQGPIVTRSSGPVARSFHDRSHMQSETTSEETNKPLFHTDVWRGGVAAGQHVRVAARRVHKRIHIHGCYSRDDVVLHPVSYPMGNTR